MWGLLSSQELAGILDEGVAAAEEIVVSEADEVVGVDAELRGLAVAVVHRAGGEPHAPPAGQL